MKSKKMNKLLVSSLLIGGVSLSQNLLADQNSPISHNIEKETSTSQRPRIEHTHLKSKMFTITYDRTNEITGQREELIGQFYVSIEKDDVIYPKETMTSGRVFLINNEDPSYVLKPFKVDNLHNLEEFEFTPKVTNHKTTYKLTPCSSTGKCDNTIGALYLIHNKRNNTWHLEVNLTKESNLYSLPGYIDLEFNNSRP